MKAFRWAAIASALLGGAPVAVCEPVKLWETDGLATPESALPDPSGSFAYVSNVNGNPTDKDGNGFISKVALKDGKIITREWAKGLDAPKGMALSKGRLYVADIDKLIEIDSADGKIVAKHDAPDAKFLNDVIADSDGNVYVSDMVTNRIWRLADGKFDVWLDTLALKNPNGLIIKDGKLIVAAWGVMADDFSTKVPGNLLTVSLADKSVKNLGDGTPVGNLDGLEPLDDASFLVTDWVAGGLYRIDASGKAELLLDLPQGSADIGWLPAERTVLIPMMNDNTLAAYKVE